MNLPGIEVELPTLTEKDKNDIVEFGVKYKVDMIALSFARTAKDIIETRNLMKDCPTIKVIAKIENQEGLHNFDSILKEADGIMVARGDLGMEIPLERVYLAQKWMVEKSNKAAKPVIVATQLLESMISNPRPTRAEVTDIMNSVLQGADFVMLSGETAGGSFPVESLLEMRKIATEAEILINHKENFKKRIQSGFGCPLEALASSVVLFSLETNSKVIICLTNDLFIGRYLSKHRPKAFILIGTSAPEHFCSIEWSYGVSAFKTDPSKGITNISKADSH